MPKIIKRTENELYHLLKDWASDEKLLLLYKYGALKPLVIDYLTIYDFYKRLDESKKNLITAVEFNISVTKVKFIVNYFTKPIENKK